MKDFFKILIVILVVACAVFLTVKGALAQNFTHVYNESELPVNDSFKLVVSLVNNESVYLSCNNSFNDSFDFFFNDSYLVEVNDSVNITVNYSILDFNVSSDEEFNFSFIINNSLNQNSAIHYFVVNILNDVNNTEVLNESEGFLVTVLNDDYVVNVTRNLLPRQGSLDYVLGGDVGETVNISCDGFLTCPSQKVFDASGEASFTVDYSIPLSVDNGQYVDYLIFNTTNNSRNVSVVFNVNPTSSAYESYYVFDEDCFDENGHILPECTEDMIQWYANALIDSLENKDKLREEAWQEGFDYCVDNQEPEYVVKGDISDTLNTEFEQCIEDRNNLKFEKNRFENKKNYYWELYVDCNSSLGSFQEDCNVQKAKIREDSIQKYENCSLRQEKVLKEAKSKVWNGAFLVFVVLLFGGLVFAYVNYKKNNSWRDIYV